MRKKEKIIDITGIELTPSRQGRKCKGNGEQGYECCCDECDYFLKCFPQYLPKKNRLKPIEELVEKSYQEQVIL